MVKGVSSAAGYDAASRCQGKMSHLFDLFPCWDDAVLGVLSLLGKGRTYVAAPAPTPEVAQNCRESLPMSDMPSEQCIVQCSYDIYLCFAFATGRNRFSIIPRVCIVSSGSGLGPVLCEKRRPRRMRVSFCGR